MNIRQFQYTIFMLLISFLLLSCASPEIQSAEVTQTGASPISTLRPATNTITPTETAVPTNTPIPPTKTLLPTSTSIPPTNTAVPTPTIDMDEIFAMAETQIAQVLETHEAKATEKAQATDSESTPQSASSSPTPEPDYTVAQPIQAENIKATVTVVLFEEEIIPLQEDAVTFLKASDGTGIDYALNVFLDNENTLWFGGVEGITTYQDSIGWQIQELPATSLISINQNQEGEIVISGCTGIYKLVANEWLSLPVDEHMRWCATRVTIANDGTIWINQLDVPQDRGHGALSIIDNQAVWYGNSWDVTYHPDMATLTPWEDGYVSAILPRENGDVWFGTTNGIFTFDGEKWGRFEDEIYGEYSWITAAIAGKDGELWIGTPTGFAQFDGERWINYQSASHTAHDIFAFTYDDNGTLWISTLTGIGYFEDNTLTLYEYGEKTPFSYTRPELLGMSLAGIVDSMVIDASGNIWMPAGPSGIMKVTLP